MKNIFPFQSRFVTTLLITNLILLTSCSIGGSDKTIINNISDNDTIVVELYKSELNPKYFEIWKEEICIDDSGRYDGPTISCQRIWIDQIRAIIYNSIDTISLKNISNCKKYEQTNQIDGLAKQNLLEILYFNRNQIKLRLHILPKNNLTIGYKSFLKNSESSLDWDTVTVYRQKVPNLKFSENTLKNYISNTVSSRSCGDCGLENHYNIDIK